MLLLALASVIAWTIEMKALMTERHARLRAHLSDAIGSADTASSRADQLCHACVRLLGVDGAAISLTADGSMLGTLGASNALSRQLGELQFTFGEGPGVDAVRDGGPVQAENLASPGEQRWLAHTASALRLGVGALFALPIGIPGSYMGVLDLYRRAPGPLRGHALVGALIAAEMAMRPVLDLVSAEATTAQTEDDLRWDGLASLTWVDVYRAAGMVMGGRARRGVGKGTRARLCARPHCERRCAGDPRRSFAAAIRQQGPPQRGHRQRLMPWPSLSAAAAGSWPPADPIGANE